MAVKGDMNSGNIRDACKAAKLRPLCDHSSYSDGTCLVAGSNWHFSQPNNLKSNGVNTNFFKGSFLYTANANGGKSLLNDGNTHRWTEAGKEANGDTICVKHVKDAKMDFKWEGRDFVRATVSGKMTSDNIRKACAAKKLVPVCDHTSYFDGQCVVAGSNVGWHFSHQSNVANQDGLDQSKLLGLYFYAGSANGQWSLENV